MGKKSGTVNTVNAPTRNTNGSVVKSRGWCFTANNYTDEDIKSFIGDWKYTFQEETGASGTPHLQGIIWFTNARSFLAVKRINPQAHWEVCRNYRASVNYCSKEDTRTGNCWSTEESLKNRHSDTVTQLTEHEKYLRAIEQFKACTYEALTTDLLNRLTGGGDFLSKLGEQEVKDFDPSY